MAHRCLPLSSPLLRPLLVALCRRAHCRCDQRVIKEQPRRRVFLFHLCHPPPQLRPSCRVVSLRLSQSQSGGWWWSVPASRQAALLGQPTSSRPQRRPRVDTDRLTTTVRGWHKTARPRVGPMSKHEAGWVASTGVPIWADNLRRSKGWYGTAQPWHQHANKPEVQLLLQHRRQRMPGRSAIFGMVWMEGDAAQVHGQTWCFSLGT